MAAAATAPRRFPKKTTPHHYCKIPLKGQVALHSRGKLTIETLKYLMFQRQQIPLPFEQLKHQYQLWQQPDGAGDRPGKQLPNLELRRWANLVKSTDEVITNIESLFSTCSVSHILIIFGATIVSPKETHHLNFTDLDNEEILEENRLSTKRCQREFMKAMITNNNLIDAKSLPLTSTHVLVFAHRQSGLSWFKPRASFKMPERGQHYTFDVQCGRVQSNNETHDCEKEPEDTMKMATQDSLGSVEGTASLTSCSESSVNEPETHMWFEAPLVIKGVKDKFTKKASSQDIWT